MTCFKHQYTNMSVFICKDILLSFNWQDSCFKRNSICTGTFAMQIGQFETALYFEPITIGQGNVILATQRNLHTYW